MTSFLEQWHDPAVTPSDKQFDLAEFFEHQADRCAQLAAMARLAADHPRRIGADASPDELATDKRLSKQTAGRFATAVDGQWGGDRSLVDHYMKDNEIKVKAAQVIWSEWWPAYYAEMRVMLATVATTCLKHGQIKSGNRACQRLLNELNTIGQIHENVQK